MTSMERSRKDPAQSFRLNPATKQGRNKGPGLAQPFQAEVVARAWGRSRAPRQEHEGGQEQLLGKGGEGTAAVSQCTHINVSKQHGHEPALTDGAILVFVCLQSCQFRSPGQKSFYLLNHMLCRTKRLADFKAYVF